MNIKLFQNEQWVKHPFQLKKIYEPCLQKLAHFLQCRMSCFSRRWQKRTLLIFCVIAGFMCVLTTYKSLFHPRKNVLKVAPITIAPFRPIIQSAPLISQQEYQHIHALRLKLDSLQDRSHADTMPLTLAGAWTLRDTLLYLEQVYQQQFKR